MVLQAAPGEGRGNQDCYWLRTPADTIDTNDTNRLPHFGVRTGFENPRRARAHLCHLCQLCHGGVLSAKAGSQIAGLTE
jgi:hypothetical protein